MARLYLSPGSQNYGPIPGGELTEVFGSNQAEKLKLAGNSDTVLDPSFVRGNDTIVIVGKSTDYGILANLAGITITSTGGADIRIPAFGTGGGIRIEFSDKAFTLATHDAGATFALDFTGGSQAIQDQIQIIGASGSTGGGAGGTPFSLDIGTATVAQTHAAGSGSFDYTDDARATSNVKLTGFGSNDHITVTHAVAGDYNFQRDFNDINDLVITYTDITSGATNSIVLDEVLPNTGAVNSFASATSAIGFAFMTFA